MAEHPATFKDLCIDAVDPSLIGRFWADTLGLEMQRREDGMTLLTGPPGQSTAPSAGCRRGCP
jgi:hypothetical protein